MSRDIHSRSLSGKDYGPEEGTGAQTAMGVPTGTG